MLQMTFGVIAFVVIVALLLLIALQLALLQFQLRVKAREALLREIRDLLSDQQTARTVVPIDAFDRRGR